MPHVIVGTASSTGGSNVSLSLPGGEQAGDLIIMATQSYDTTAVTPDAGWTIVTDNYGTGGSWASRQVVGWRLHTAGGPTSFNWVTSSTISSGVLIVIRPIASAGPVGAVVSTFSSSPSNVFTVPSATGSSGGLLVAIAGGMHSNSSTHTVTAAAPLTHQVRAASGYTGIAIGTEELAASGATGTRTINGDSITGSWVATNLIVAPAGFEPSTAQVAFGGSAEMQGGAPVHFISGTASMLFAATQPFFANTYLTAVVPVVFATQSYWQPGVALDTTTDAATRPSMTFAGRGQLDVVVPPVTPPSDMVYVKRVSTTMPVAVLDSRGRPI